MISLKRVLILPDSHHPFSDKYAVDLMLTAARDLRPDIIITLGDVADFYSVSSHSKDPNRVAHLEDEVLAVNDYLDSLDTLGASRKVFIAGNHCDRLSRYLAERAPAVFNSMSIEKLFRLQERGWEYVPYKSHIKIGSIYYTHDTGTAGKYAHYKAGDSFQHNAVIGHTHRAAISYSGNAVGESHVSAMFGWLGDRTKIDYMSEISTLTGWQTGFGLGYMEPDGTTHLQIIPVIGKRIVVEGRLYGV